MEAILDPATTAYTEALLRALEAALGRDLTGVYLFGSAALDDYHPPRSDLDVAVVSGRPLAAGEKAGLADRLDHRNLPCPARKLELVVYERDRLARGDVSYELDLNTGPGLQEWRVDPSEGPSHWFVLDVAIGRHRGRPLSGPPPARVFPEQERATVLAALKESLGWHADRVGEGGNVGADPADVVLNACRARLFLEEGRWSSKTDAGRWAADRSGGGDVVRRALERRQGCGTGPDAGAARAFATDVLRRTEGGGESATGRA